MDNINSLEDLAKLLANHKFESKPFHCPIGRTVTWFFEDIDHYAQWINHDLTIYREREEDRIVGIQISDKILDTERRPR